MAPRWFKSRRRLAPIHDIAIDLGTANTLVYVRGDGVVVNEPCVVAVEKSSREILAVGLDAKHMLGRTPGEIEAVRPLKDGVIADVDVTEMMLRHILKRITARRMFQMKPRVVLGVPSGITELERRAVRSSALAAGAKSVFMVVEPVAAAVGMGLPIESPSGNMVVDIGGGTTEIAVICLSGVVADSSIRTGGDKIDNAILDAMRKHYKLLIGEPTAEMVKVQIGSAFDTGEEHEMDVKGRDLVSGMPKTIRIGSSEVREWIQEPIRAIVEAVCRALEATPAELSADIVDKGLLMTGGGAMIPGLDQLIAFETSLTVHVDDDPLTCVVRGAGRILEDLPAFRKVLTT